MHDVTRTCQVLSGALQIREVLLLQATTEVNDRSGSIQPSADAVPLVAIAWGTAHSGTMCAHINIRCPKKWFQNDVSPWRKAWA